MLHRAAHHLSLVSQCKIHESPDEENSTCTTHREFISINAAENNLAEDSFEGKGKKIWKTELIHGEEENYLGFL